MAEKNVGAAKVLADGASGPTARAAYEKAGAANAFLEARKEQLSEREQKVGMKDGHAKELRRQIEELRAQLSRYAEALEEDLNHGREKVAARTRDGLNFEKLFTESTNLLVGHLKGKPEVRDLFQELMEVINGPQPARPTDARPPVATV